MTHKTIIFFCIAIFIATAHIIFCCTGIRLLAEDDTIIYARTLEWRKNLNPHAVVIPRNMFYTGTSIDNKKGLQWKSLYAFTGITIDDLPFVIDGVNEHGLAAGLFSFRDDVEYHTPDSNSTHNDLAPWELITYILSMCRTVEEIKNIISTIKIVPVFFEIVDEIPPLHYIVHDKDGYCVVLEHAHNSINIYDNPLGIITNSPNFDWHITHLDTYLNPSFDNHKISSFADLKKMFAPYKTLHESYALGLPSDFSSSSRFIRAAVYTLCSPTPATGYLGILQAFHILNQFDIPKGSFRTSQEDYFTYTHWTSAVNITEKKYYFRTHENQRIRMIDLTKTDYNSCNILWFSMDTPEDIETLV